MDLCKLPKDTELFEEFSSFLQSFINNQDGEQNEDIQRLLKKTIIKFNSEKDHILQNGYLEEEYDNSEQAEVTEESYCEICNCEDIVSDKYEYFGSCAGDCDETNYRSLCSQHAMWDDTKKVWFCYDCYLVKETFYDHIDEVYKSLNINLDEASSETSDSENESDGETSSDENPPDYFLNLWQTNFNGRKKENEKEKIAKEELEKFIGNENDNSEILLYKNSFDYVARMENYLQLNQVY